MKTILTSAAIAALVAVPVQAGTLANVFTSFYSFGDSLSDDGKFGALDAPSLGGRFTNGPVWAEYIEDQFIAAGRDTGNLAQGGATAGNVNLSPAGPLSTFAGQIGTFAGALSAGFGLPTKVLPTPEFKATPPDPGANPLVSVWFGANDIFQGFSPVDAANAVADGIRAIGSIAGQSFDDFLVMALPDIGATPAFAGPGSAGATAATNLFNAQLALNIVDLEAEGFKIVSFDPNEVTKAIMDDIASGTFDLGIFDTTTPCTVNIGAPLDPTFTNPGSCVDLGVDPNTLLFVDGVHPNAVAHRLVAEGAIAAVEATVPLPGTLPLLITVLAGLGLVARRRRAA